MDTLKSWRLTEQADTREDKGTKKEKLYLDAIRTTGIAKAGKFQLSSITSLIFHFILICMLC